MDRLKRWTKLPKESEMGVDEGLQRRMTVSVPSSFATRLDALISKPRRHWALHWSAFVLSVVSLVIGLIWVTGARDTVPPGWVSLDIGLGVVFAVEFFTRSGFRWNRVAYTETHFFDFIAMVPVLALINHSFALEGIWVWLVMAARSGRTVDRLFGDGFVRRNVFALLEGFEEEITDRVLLNIIARIQSELDQGRFGHRIAEVLGRNRGSVLQRIRAAHPRQGVWIGLANVMGLDEALARAEERTYDAIVDIMSSPEVDRAIRDALNSTFSGMQEQIRVKTWRRKLGFRRRETQSEKPD